MGPDAEQKFDTHVLAAGKVINIKTLSQTGETEKLLLGRGCIYLLEAQSALVHYRPGDGEITLDDDGIPQGCRTCNQGMPIEIATTTRETWCFYVEPGGWATLTRQK